MCLAILSSSSTLTSSLSIQIISNRDANGGGRPVSLNDLITLSLGPRLVNLPSLGLAAARMEQRVFKVALTPPFDTSRRCCSIAGCMVRRSSSLILSNSSIAAIPRSDRGNTPASKAKRPPPPKSSRTAAAVSPAPDTPPPVANIPRGESLDM